MTNAENMARMVAGWSLSHLSPSAADMCRAFGLDPNAEWRTPDEAASCSHRWFIEDLRLYNKHWYQWHCGKCGHAVHIEEPTP